MEDNDIGKFEVVVGVGVGGRHDRISRREGFLFVLEIFVEEMANGE